MSTGETEADPAAVAAAAVVPVGVSVTACWAGGAAGPAGGAAPVAVPAASFLPPAFPFRALNSVEQGSSVGVGQTPAQCCDLCLSGVPRFAAHFLQVFY